MNTSSRTVMLKKKGVSAKTPFFMIFDSSASPNFTRLHSESLMMKSNCMTTVSDLFVLEPGISSLIFLKAMNLVPDMTQ
eukprot:CAMPEP_0173310892 /NCGR_PEP_ID=MMETSP1143-20121109/23192_1 /TAXON_ID=483371 /ORGANISM="non described non described, Strain CCMP2298" /LENGTH=78 /DNA_ID=CAMNT_0014252753 /DNA_START=231 /DNA_END=467 /DNA_ORIENTATION=-